MNPVDRETIIAGTIRYINVDKGILRIADVIDGRPTISVTIARVIVSSMASDIRARGSDRVSGPMTGIVLRTQGGTETACTSIVTGPAQRIVTITTGEETGISIETGVRRRVATTTIPIDTTVIGIDITVQDGITSVNTVARTVFVTTTGVAAIMFPVIIDTIDT